MQSTRLYRCKLVLSAVVVVYLSCKRYPLVTFVTSLEEREESLFFSSILNTA
jgi:hypothetical protein